MVKLLINNETIKNIKLIIFDKDGTLMDLYTYWYNMVAFRADLAQKKFGINDMDKEEIIYAMGVDLKMEKLRSEGPVGLKKREIVMQAMISELEKKGFHDTYDICKEIFSEVDKNSQKYFADIIRPIKGMHKLIDDLYDNGCKIAIATTDKSERAKLAMQYLNISDKIEIIVGDDMVDNCKPSPDMVNMIVNKLDIAKEITVMVGDAITDIEMGINAGLKYNIGVCSGLTSREKLLEKTKYVVEDISYISVFY